MQRLSEFCDEFLVHGVDVEGKQVGILVRGLIGRSVGGWVKVGWETDGTWRGMADRSPRLTARRPKEDLVVLLGEASPLPVTYAGGARSIEDLERVTELGKGKVRKTGGGVPAAVTPSSDD